MRCIALLSNRLAKAALLQTILLQVCALAHANTVTVSLQGWRWREDGGYEMLCASPTRGQALRIGQVCRS